LGPKLDAEVERARAEMDKLDPPAPPIFTEKPINTELQTGESQLLGGEMRLRAPWVPESED
jgi:hypothetical protein